MPEGFRRVLVANRGEIAVRVLRTLRELDLTGIAVYSDVDRTALHVLHADEAYALGPAPAAESYLNVERLLAVARAVRAEAVHPGYGFLSENADFAAACEGAGLVFLGPPPAAIRRMGNKLAARELARAAGAPLIPGSPGPVASLDEARAEAERIGYPVLLKAAAGGGGKGMRVVAEVAALPAAFELTRGEARAAFGDDQVYLERYLERPRHVEAQVLADAHGQVLFLGERECSVQRRHQKVLEETPSPALTPAARTALGEAACAIARAAGYASAGTVEFIVDERGEFYFLEMNTRLQVEHPVTELVTGVDLVRAQIDVASGRSLPWRQEDLRQRGHAIEVRIYAEDPDDRFLPQSGRIVHLEEPAGPGIRVDSGVMQGTEIGVKFDPMLAKVICHAEDRGSCIDRMARALGQTVLLGTKTNVSWLRRVVTHPAFREGLVSTRFLEDHSADLALDVPPLIPLIAAAIAAAPRKAVAATSTAPRIPSVWESIGEWGRG